MSISKLLFGEIAIKKRLVTKEQVEECLDIQRKLKEMGITKTLGAVMHDKKYLSMVEIKEILREMTGTKEWNAIEGYEIVGKLGKGGMGSVYKARHQKLDKMVALKVLPPELAGDQEYLDRFLREARAAAKLNHKNIVQALDVGESYGYHYFVMEYVDGRTIKDIIEQDGPINEGKTLDYMEQISSALEHAWTHGMVHRDIKPSNLIVNEAGQAKLCDLGLAKSVTEDSTITQTGVIMGTPFYLSPEQARSEDLDCRSDIYSLGITMFHMLTGQVPFTGNSAATILYKHIFLESPKAKSLNPRLTSGVSDLVARMLAKSRDERPQSPTTLIQEIQGLRGNLGPGEDAPPRREERAERPSGSSGRLDNTLIESGPSGQAEAGSASERTGEIGAISGPNVAVEGGDGALTIDERLTTGQLKSAQEQELRILPPRPHADPRAPARQKLLAVASLGGLVGIGALLFLKTQPPPPLSSEQSQIALLTAIIGATHPHADIASPIAKAAELRGQKKPGEAIALLSRAQGERAAQKGVEPVAVSGADEQALGSTRDGIVTSVKHDFEKLDTAYKAAILHQGGENPAPIVKAVRELDVPAVVRLLEAERQRLQAEREALARPEGPQR